MPNRPISTFPSTRGTPLGSRKHPPVSRAFALSLECNRTAQPPHHHRRPHSQSMQRSRSAASETIVGQSDAGPPVTHGIPPSDTVGFRPFNAPRGPPDGPVGPRASSWFARPCPSGNFVARRGCQMPGWQPLRWAATLTRWHLDAIRIGHTVTPSRFDTTSWGSHE